LKILHRTAEARGRLGLAPAPGFDYNAMQAMSLRLWRDMDRLTGSATGPLPPTLSQGDKDRARYMAVGETDNFVLRFRKPFHTSI